MTAAVITLGILCAALVTALVLVVRLLLQRITTAETAVADERRELLNRIQRPDVLPIASSTPFVVPEQEPDDIGEVGEITFDVDKLLTD